MKKVTTPKEVANCLDHLNEGCFLSASQAADLMQDAYRMPAKERFKWWHVVCSRVVDKWRLTEKDHSQIYCYYGWDERHCLQLAEGVALDDHITLQNKVLSRMGRGDHTEYAYSRRVPEFAAIVIASNLQAGSSGTRADLCAVCLEDCEDGSPLFTCASCANRLHARCCRGWMLAKESKGEDAQCPYCRAPIQDGKWSIGELPKASNATNTHEAGESADEPVDLS